MAYIGTYQSSSIFRDLSCVMMFLTLVHASKIFYRDDIKLTWTFVSYAPRQNQIDIG